MKGKTGPLSERPELLEKLDYEIKNHNSICGNIKCFCLMGEMSFLKLWNRWKYPIEYRFPTFRSEFFMLLLQVISIWYGLVFN